MYTFVHRESTPTPNTLLKWIRAEKKLGKKVPPKRGRRRTPDDIRELILQLARENQWGYTRILGEIKKLGIRSISRNTVKRILKEAGLDPGPKRGEGTWDEFLKQHAASLWQVDFFSQRVLTLKGIRDAFVIVFLNVKTRQVVLSPATMHPDEAWCVAQAESFVKQARDRGLPVKQVQHDLDTKFTKSFDHRLKSYRVQSRRMLTARLTPTPLWNGSFNPSGRNASIGSWCSGNSIWIPCVPLTWPIITQSVRTRAKELIMRFSADRRNVGDRRQNAAI